MRRPDLTPECARGHAPGSSGDRRIVAVGLVIVGAPFLFGALGAVSFADIALGPSITFAVWLVVLAVRLARSKDNVFIAEWLAVIGCLLVMQILLDLHTQYLGDLVIAGLHVPLVIVATIGAWRARRAAG